MHFLSTCRSRPPSGNFSLHFMQLERFDDGAISTVLNVSDEVVSICHVDSSQESQQQQQQQHSARHGNRTASRPICVLLFTHADKQSVDISFTVCFLFVCTVTDFSGVKFYRGCPGQGISQFGELYSPKSPKSGESERGEWT